MKKIDLATEQQRFDLLLCFEKELYLQGYQWIAGTDEAGRGPLAGPVVAAAVILPQEIFICGLNDSKKLSEKRRLLLEKEIQEKAIAWSVAEVSAAQIDEINILEASRLAMRQAVQGLRVAPDYLLTDAVAVHQLTIPQRNIIKGDCLSATIAAASILAKNHRDRLMCQYDEVWPEYGFAQ
ncbi:MAG: ribonuclease HII, partial [Clostridiales bacterium]